MKRITCGVLAASIAMLVSVLPAAPAMAGGGHGHSDPYGSSQSANRHDDRGDGHRADRGDGHRGDRGDRHRDGRHDGHGGRDRDRPEHVTLCTQNAQKLVRAETGVGFGSVSECIQHGALGGTYSLLDVDTTARYDCPGGGTCWGVLIGQGLQPESEVSVTWSAAGAPGSLDLLSDDDGDLPETSLNFACGTPIAGIRALGTTSGGLSLEAAPVAAPC